MRFQDIELPLDLFKQINFAERIEKVNFEVYEYSDYLKRLIEKFYSTTLNLCKESRRLVLLYEKKLPLSD